MPDAIMTPERARGILTMLMHDEWSVSAEDVAAIRPAIDALAAVERVRALHVRDHGSDPWSGETYDVCHGCFVAWPCPTIRALDAQETADAE